MSKKSEMGILGILGVFIGGGCLLVALISVFNVAFDLRWSLSVYGTAVQLPRSWDVVVGVAAGGVLIGGLSLFGSAVIRRFKAAKGRPLMRVGILVGALALLIVAGRGLQVLALTGTYGSMLAYYATDGDLDDVRAELADDPPKAHLDAAVRRAAQYSNAPALALLLDHGADLMQSTQEGFRYCVLSRADESFIKVALEKGVTPATCVDSEALIWNVIHEGGRDEDVARKVELLAQAGWSKTAAPKDRKATTLELAQQRKLPLTIKALGG